MVCWYVAAIKTLTITPHAALRRRQRFQPVRFSNASKW